MLNTTATITTTTTTSNTNDITHPLESAAEASARMLSSC